MDGMSKYFVLYGDYAEWFVCSADSADHAAEQAYDFTNNDQIHGIWRGEQDDGWLECPTFADES